MAETKPPEKESFQVVADTVSPSSALLHQTSDPPVQNPATHQRKSQRNRSYYSNFGLIRGVTAAQMSIAAVILSAIIPFVALITWIARRSVDGSSFSTFSGTFAGERIGGRLTQPQAKAIDVVASAILAPLTMALFNFILFNNARVSVVNEKDRKSIPLRSLITASAISSVRLSFSSCILEGWRIWFGEDTDRLALTDIHNLIQSRSWKLFLLALLTLLAALSKTAFTNTVAYEAYETADVTSQSRLRLQTDGASWYDILWATGGLEGSTFANRINLTLSQQEQLTTQLSAMLASLPSRNISKELANAMYLAGNVTQNSLDNLPRSIVKLRDVPAYRLSMDCRTDLSTRISIEYHINEQFTTTIRCYFDYEVPGQGKSATTMVSRYPGTVAEVGGQQLYTWPFSAFESLGAFKNGNMEVFLGVITPFNLTNETGPSTSYGKIKYRAFNMSAVAPANDPPLFVGYRQTQSVYGLRCSILREEGVLDYTRVTSSNGSTSAWNISNFEVSGASNKTRVPAFLAPYQGYSLNFHLPQSYNPGLGPAFLPRNADDYPGTNNTVPSSQEKVSLDQFALRFLYASGEAQRIVYEVLAMTTNASQHLPEFFVDVPSIATKEYYRITLVPSLLMLGLITLILAGVLTTVMMAYTWNTTSMQTLRRVDEVRVVVDSARNLSEDAEGVLQLVRSSNEDIDAWAAQYMVRYQKTEVEGMTTIMLENN